MRAALRAMYLGFANALGRNSAPGSYDAGETVFWAMAGILFVIYGVIGAVYNITGGGAFYLDTDSVLVVVLILAGILLSGFIARLVFERDGGESPYLLPVIFISVHGAVILVEAMLWTWMTFLWPDSVRGIDLWNRIVLSLEAMLVYRAFLLHYRLTPARLQLRLILTAVLCVAATHMIPTLAQQSPYYIAQPYVREEPRIVLNPEQAFARQPDLMQAALDKIEPSLPGDIDFFTVTFGADGYQGVFKREALFAQQALNTALASRRRSVALVNHPDTVGSVPLATITNLRAVFRDLRKKGQRDEDVLVLYLTSHGAENSSLSVDLPGVGMLPVDARILATALKESGFRWKVVIVSACFSGSYIPLLKSDNTLIITAAAANKTSFGCSDTADLTYFGQAFLKDAIPESSTFQEAFDKAATLIAEREKAEKLEPSNPQISMGKKIVLQIDRFRKRPAQN